MRGLVKANVIVWYLIMMFLFRNHFELVLLIALFTLMILNLLNELEDEDD